MDALAIIEDDVSFGSDREARLARLDELAQIKDDAIPYSRRFELVNKARHGRRARCSGPERRAPVCTEEPSRDYWRSSGNHIAFPGM